MIQSAARFWSDIIEGTQESNPLGLEIHFGHEKIDGPGRALAYAAPFNSYFPALGFVIFDSADLDRLTESGELLNIAMHEIGHVLGFGTLWESRKLLLGKRTGNPVFAGGKASEEYYKLLHGKLSQSGETHVPVENTGGSGVRNSHWRESIFKNELMTGYANHKEVLSRVTVASLEDLGYHVSYDNCDNFSL